MKIKRILEKIPTIAAELRAFLLLKLGSEGQASKMSGFELLGWALLFASVSTSLLHLFVSNSPLRAMQERMDKQDTFQFQVASDNGKLYARALYPKRPPGARPELLRVDLAFVGTLIGQRRDGQEYGFFELGLKRLSGVIVPVMRPLETPSVVMSDNKEQIEEIIRTVKWSAEEVALIQKDQDRVKDWLVDEVSLGYAFSRVVFRHALVGHLGRNGTYMLILCVMLAFTTIVTLHLAASLAKRPSRFRGALDLGLRLTGILVLMVALLNLLFTPLSTLSIWSGESVMTMAAAAFLAFFLVPALAAVANYYRASASRLLLILAIALPLSFVTGILFFAPVIAVATVYSDILSIFI